jgi:hypothetical protein
LLRAGQKYRQVTLYVLDRFGPLEEPQQIMDEVHRREQISKDNMGEQLRGLSRELRRKATRKT